MNNLTLNGKTIDGLGVSFQKRSAHFGNLETWGTIDPYYWEQQLSIPPGMAGAPDWNHATIYYQLIKTLNFNLAATQLSNVNYDIDGDGKKDMIVIAPIRDADNRVVDIRLRRRAEFETGPVGLLKHVKDGFGNWTSFLFSNLRNKDVYVPFNPILQMQTTAPSEEKIYQYPEAPITPSGAFVLHQIERDLGERAKNEPKTFERTRFKYRSGSWAQNGEGMLGFEVVESKKSHFSRATGSETLLSGTIERRPFTFDQEYGSFITSAAAPVETISYSPCNLKYAGGSPSLMISHQQNTLATKTHEVYGMRLVFPYSESTSAKSYALSRQDCSPESYECFAGELSGFEPKTETVSEVLGMDDYGNVVQFVQNSNGLANTQTQASTSDTERWCFLLDSEEKTATYDGRFVSSETAHTFTAECSPDVTTREPNGSADAYLETDIDYDSFGNIKKVETRTKDFPAPKSIYHYDATGIFVAAKVNSLGHITKFGYHDNLGLNDLPGENWSSLNVHSGPVILEGRWRKRYLNVKRLSST